jgi:hypothetical protein
LGQTVYMAKPNDKHISLLLEKEGLYFVTVRCGQQTTVRKLIVER